MTLTFVSAKCEMVKYRANLRHCTKDISFHIILILVHPGYKINHTKRYLCLLRFDLTESIMSKEKLSA